MDTELIHNYWGACSPFVIITRGDPFCFWIYHRGGGMARDHLQSMTWGDMSHRLELLSDDSGHSRQIGRASCRERV